MRSMRRRTALQLGLWGAATVAAPHRLHAQGSRPVRVGVDAEFSLVDSTSAQAIELGLRAAIHEINAAGGVLGGRPLELVLRDNRSTPARALANVRELAGIPDLVAVFGGKFSPVVLDSVPLVHELRLPFFAVWSSADAIIDNLRRPNFVFRVALRDSLAMPKLLSTAQARNHRRVGLLLANTGWGRSNLAAAQAHVSRPGQPQVAGVAWFNWGETTLLKRYQGLLEAGAQTVVLVANDDDAAVLVRELATQPRSDRLPLLAHQGITGGRFVEAAGAALQAVDLSVVQTFSFQKASARQREKFLRSAAQVAGVTRIEEIMAPTGVAHAYDALHILARAIDSAGSTDRVAIRSALERVPEHQGLIKHYRPPFTSERHEALGPEELLIARYRADGVLVPA